MIKLLVLLFSFSSFALAGDQEWLLAGIDVDTTSSNETEVDQCEDELTNVKVCLSSVLDKHEIPENKSEILFNQDLMLSILDDFRNASCFGTTNCTNVKVGEYVYDGSVFIGEAVYRHGFDCLKKEFDTIQEKAQQCVNMIILSGKVKEQSIDNFFLVAKLISECTISRFDCRKEEKYALIAAAVRIIDMGDGFINPEKILKEIGVSEDAISREELTTVLADFISLF